MPKCSPMTIILASVPTLMIACAEPLSVVVDDTSQHYQGGAQPEKWACYDPVNPHCLPTPPDPYPAAPGVFLNNTEEDCWASYGNLTDTDQDGLGDLCEYQLAYNFAPMMRSAATDDTRGEPYWAVQPAGNGRFHVFYALAYYWDFGGGDMCQAATNGTVIADWLPGIDKTFYCDGHQGDSEFLIAEVAFDSVTGHWLLERMYRSAHYNSPVDNSAWLNAESWTYPAKAQWYPLVYTAIGKHANYPSVSSCEELQQVWILMIPWWYQRDDCSYASFKESRVSVLTSRNLGSRAYPAADVPISPDDQYTCVRSTDRFAGNGRQECFWKTAHVFRGWQDAAGVTGYGDILMDRGF